MKNATDDNEMSSYRQCIKKQFKCEPVFIRLHPQDKTEGGVYEFEVTVGVEKTRRCFIWRFVNTIASGQMAMDVAPPDTVTSDDVVAQWLAMRKQAEKMIR